MNNSEKIVLLVDDHAVTLHDFIRTNYFTSDVLKLDFATMKQVCRMEVGDKFYVELVAVERIV